VQYELVTPPASEPVTLAEAKAHLRVDIPDDDAAITALITAARQRAETITNRSLITQTWRAWLDGFPSSLDRRGQPSFRLGRGPVASVSSVKYIDTAGALQTLSPSAYVLDNKAQLGQHTVRPAYGSSWPATRDELDSVQVEYVAGFGAANAVPEPIKTAMLQYVAHWYANRETVITGTIVAETPMAGDTLLWPYRLDVFA
jgi:uncharacterized phiE125 gp8 family phage protein